MGGHRAQDALQSSLVLITGLPATCLAGEGVEESGDEKPQGPGSTLEWPGANCKASFCFFGHGGRPRWEVP